MIGDFEEAKIHFAGMKAMIRSRKESQNLGYEGLITRIVQWYGFKASSVTTLSIHLIRIAFRTDTCHSVLANSELAFDDLDVSPRYSQPLPRRSSKLLHPGAAPFKLKDHKLILEMREVSAELVATHRAALPNERRVSLGNWLLASNRQLLKQMRTQHQGPNISVIVATAAFMYMQVVLRGMSRTARVTRCLVKQLKASLISALSSKKDVFSGDPASLSWTLLVGLLASGKENDEGTWFLWCLERACGNAEIFRGKDLTKLRDSPNHISPQPFYWILDQKILELSSVETKTLVHGA